MDPIINKVILSHGYGKLIKMLGETETSKVGMYYKNNVSYAIKVMTKNTVMYGMEEYLNEINSLKRCNHPNIIKLFDNFEHQENDQRYFFVVMECGICNLADLIDSIGKNESEEISELKLSISKQIFSGIIHLYNNSILSGDIKPENIIVFEDYRVAISDFGLSQINIYSKKDKYWQRNITYTREYSAPELLLGGRYSEKVELWAFGCILHELYKDDLLFNGSTDDIFLKLGYDVEWYDLKYMPNWDRNYEKYPQKNLQEFYCDRKISSLLKNIFKITPHKRPNLEKIVSLKILPNKEKILTDFERLEKYDEIVKFDTNCQKILISLLKNKLFPLILEFNTSPRVLILAIQMFRRINGKNDLELDACLYLSYCFFNNNQGIVIYSKEDFEKEEMAAVQSRVLEKLDCITVMTTPFDYIDLYKGEYSKKIIKYSFILATLLYISDFSGNYSSHDIAKICLKNSCEKYNAIFGMKVAKTNFQSSDITDVYSKMDIRKFRNVMDKIII